MPHKKRPAYQFHKASGQAKVRINGKDIYLGVYGSPASRERYESILVEWATTQSVGQSTLTVADLSLSYLDAAKRYYVKSGEVTSEISSLKVALRPLIACDASTLCSEFGPRRLKQVREVMVSKGWTRTTINSSINRIRRMFRWGVEQEIVAPQVLQALNSVPGLRRGRFLAREPQEILPVDDSVVAATLPHLPNVVADMVRLQLLTGMRPGEVCSMRPIDIHRAHPDDWTYSPVHHKTEHRGRDRRVFIGSRGQEILSPYLNRAPETPCFSPEEAEATRNRGRRARRQTPMKPSDACRQKRPRTFCSQYDKNTYNRAIQRGCELAFQIPVELRYVSRYVGRREDLSENERKKLCRRLCAEAAEWRKKALLTSESITAFGCDEDSPGIRP
ncbi:MAG: site-specific integrase [Planctomycetaceae bacterium]|nr:site-specific integrase [Planctomycetaceae bacterium]